MEVRARAGPGVGSAPYRPDGAEQIFGPASPASAQNPLYSPDSAHLAFTLFHEGYNDGPAGIYLLTPGMEPSALIDEPGQDCVNLPGSAWNAATGRITFSSDRAGREEIWTIMPDGTGLARVTDHADERYYIEPSFSPGGEWIVFEADLGVPDDRQQGSIWKVRSDGGEVVALTDGPAGGTDDRQPNWSPAGDRILFQRRVPGTDDWNVFTIAPDGSALAQVTTSLWEDTDASWSPDGEWIAYSSDHGGLERPSLFVIAAAGGEPLRVTSDPSAADGAPSWSPDGSWIAFESHGEDEGPASLWRIAAPFAPGECTLLCTATVPECAGVLQEIAFSASATPVDCTGAPDCAWDYGDGSPNGSGATTTHAYGLPGDYLWTMTARLDNATCPESGSIRVSQPVAISSIAKRGNPFRLIVAGCCFHEGAQVYIGEDATPWPQVKRVSENELVIKKAKPAFPKDQAVQVCVANPGDCPACATFTR